MLVKIRRGWEMREAEATPEAAFWNRRAFLQGTAAGVGALALGSIALPRLAGAAEPRGIADLFPAKRDAAYTLDRDLTAEEVASTYNNFYEFGSHKRIASAAEKLKPRPWTVKIDGMVEQPITVDADELIRKMPVEERLYRHRCVEAWAMAVPWTGFPFAELVKFAKPLSGAKYVQMETFQDPDMASGQKQFWYPWPYIEGLSMAEANNELAFLVMGVYGKTLPNQFGAPLRLAVPWKYGFKSVKSIVRFSFVEQRPVSFWEKIQPKEYGFWANVNPEVPHPRWSQAQEELIGVGKKVPTQLFNGYGAQVAGLYTGLQGETLYR